MSDLSDDLHRFIQSSVRSVWALEILFILKNDRRSWLSTELVDRLRASALVVTNSIDSLVIAGLASIDQEGASYTPVNDDIARCVDKLESLYAVRPDAVRRAIVSSTISRASAFGDAFKLRKD